MYQIDKRKLTHSPRAVRFWECCLAVFYEKLSIYKYVKDSKVNINGLVENDTESKFYLDTAFEHYETANKYHFSSTAFEDLSKKKHIFERRTKSNIDSGGSGVLMQEFIVNRTESISKVKIAVANTKVLEANIIASLRGRPNFSGSRFDTLYKIFDQAKLEGADVLVFPECFMPIEFLDRITWYAVNEQKMVVTGLEHVTIDDVSFNFIVTILPFVYNGIKDAVVVYRLKNHYSHAEALMVHANHYKIPIPETNIYDLYIWKGIYFSPYYCFELADIHDRSLFKGKIDLLIASEWNPDVNYFSNIVESISRDLHVYVTQVNSSQFGDTRITQPAPTIYKDILKLKGGTNDTILVGEIDIAALREFQRVLYMATKDDKSFKPLPPNYSQIDVLNRIANKSVLK